MSLKMTTLTKSNTTNITRVRLLFTCSFTYQFFAIWSNTTSIAFIKIYLLHTPMCIKTGTVCKKKLTTNITLVRFLTCMWPFVSLEIVYIRKFITENITFIRFLSYVYFFILQKVATVIKSNTTNFTSVNFLCMCFLKWIKPWIIWTHTTTTSHF